MVVCSSYMSPEYLSSGQYSVKSDIFSFGIVLLEIISGQKRRFGEDDLLTCVSIRVLL